MSDLEKEIRYFSSLPLSFIEPFGRGGTDFLHGLLEGHSEISTLPSMWTGGFDKVNFHNSDPVYIDDVLKKASNISQYWRLNKIEYSRDQIHQYSARYVDSIGFSADSLVRAVHYSWSKVIGDDIFNLKVIVWHSHRGLWDKNKPWDIQDILRDSRGRISYLIACRDPRESLISKYIYNQGTSSYEYPSPEWNHYLYNGLALKYLCDSLVTFNHFFNKENVVFGRVEALNANPEQAMRNLADFLQVSFEPSLLIPCQKTDSGRGITGYGARANEIRWFNELKDTPALLILETLFVEPIRLLGYPQLESLITRRNWLYAILLILVMPFHPRFYSSALRWELKNAQSKYERNRRHYSSTLEGFSRWARAGANIRSTIGSVWAFFVAIRKYVPQAFRLMYLFCQCSIYRLSGRYSSVELQLKPRIVRINGKAVSACE